MKFSNTAKLIYHSAVAFGFLGLIGWFYIGRESGLLEWIMIQLPDKFAGSAVMIGIIIIMTPGFFIWSRYNRWIEKRLKVKGFYYEDTFYGNPNKPSDRK